MALVSFIHQINYTLYANKNNQFIINILLKPVYIFSQ